MGAKEHSNSKEYNWKDNKYPYFSHENMRTHGDFILCIAIASPSFKETILQILGGPGELLSLYTTRTINDSHTMYTIRVFMRSRSGFALLKTCTFREYTKVRTRPRHAWSHGHAYVQTSPGREGREKQGGSRRFSLDWMCRVLELW